MISSIKKKSRFDMPIGSWRPWNDLPQDILCLIIQSKNLLLSERLRFRAVCKSWCIPKDHIIKLLSSSSSASSEYPWLFCCLPTPCYNADDFTHSFRFQLVEPRYYKSLQVSKSIDKSSYKNPIFHPLTFTYASKFGWRLHGIIHGSVWSLFFHNPFSNDHIVLPPLLGMCEFECNHHAYAATFTASPSSRDSCEVLALFQCGRLGTLNIGRYKHSGLNGEVKSGSWTTQVLGDASTDIKVHYMDGKLYCLFDRFVLGSYSLVDKTWELVSNSKLPISRWTLLPIANIWLTQIGSSLAMVCRPEQIELQEKVEWMVFKFNWSRKRWIKVGEDLRNIAFFIVEETIISLPLEDDDDCLIYHHDKEMNCYSFKQRKNKSPESYPSLNQVWNFLNSGLSNLLCSCSFTLQKVLICSNSFVYQ